MFSIVSDFRLEKVETQFIYIGLDTLLPFLLLNGEKRWIRLCTCLVTRAVSYELLPSMTSEDFAFTFRCFAARRAFPKLHLSDNASQFHTFRHILTLLLGPTEWKFIPQESPWFGAVYERFVVKNSLLRTFCTLNFNDRHLSTVLFEIIVNDHPLTYDDDDIDVQPSTPNHFIRKFVSKTTPIIDPVHVYFINRNLGMRSSNISGHNGVIYIYYSYENEQIYTI